ncbi:MAG: hypothetical protein K2N05_10810, partial [Muribaculaceae bacterium]|nr:hypothetical protein [Muribaculaceae bacterium]
MKTNIMKLTVILSSLIILFDCFLVRAEMVTRTRMVVDTVAAMKMIKEKIDNKNLPNKNKINISEKKIVDLQNSLRNIESKKNEYDHLFSLIEPKIKDYQLSVKLYDVLAEELPNIPADSIYKYAKKGDYKKAVNDKMWREKLADLCQKTIDNVLKDAQKGKFGSGLVKSCFLYRLAQLNDEIDAKSKDIKHEVDTRDLISEKLISIPSNFTAELWLTEMPN